MRERACIAWNYGFNVELNENIKSNLVDLRLDSRYLESKILHKVEVEISIDIFFLIINFLWGDL